MSGFMFIVFTLSFHAFCLHITSAANVPNSVRDTTNDDEVPVSCRNLTYCTVKPANYPEKQFDEMFKDYKLLQQPQLVVELTDKFGGDEINCESDITFEPLYKVRQKRDDPWYTVVQAPGRNLLQRVRLETCKKPGAPCFSSFCSNTEFKTTCKEISDTWEVLVSKKDGKIETIKAQLPVCCRCFADQIPFITINEK